MANINRVKIFCLIYLLCWSSCSSYDFEPYASMPFSVEKYVAFDSILATYGDDFTGKHSEHLLTNCFLITGYADTINTEKKIDSLLLTLIDSNYIGKRTYWLYFFKKARKCSNEFTRRNRDYSENNNYDKYLLYFYDYRNRNYQNNLNLSISIVKKDQFNKSCYMFWNSTNIVKDSLELEQQSLKNIPEDKRNPGMEAWFEQAVNIQKDSLKRKGIILNDDIKRYGFAKNF